VRLPLAQLPARNSGHCLLIFHGQPGRWFDIGAKSLFVIWVHFVTKIVGRDGLVGWGRLLAHAN
jgi:hypothetical protein